MSVISGGSSGAVSVATVSLTNAQVLALPTTPITVVAPPGAGRLIRFIYGWAQKDFTAGVYTNNGDTGMYFVYDTVNLFDPASVTADGGVTDTWLTNASIRQMDFPPHVSTAAGVVVPTSSGADLRNTNLGFSIDNSLGAFTGGNALNTLSVGVLYQIVTP
jgi:hypothetical protein